MEFLHKLGAVLLSLYSVLTAYHILFFLAGFFTKSKIYPEARENHTYGIVISARNEEKVIGKLLDSIALQDYDPSLLRVYVVADNCTDRSAGLSDREGHPEAFAGHLPRARHDGDRHHPQPGHHPDGGPGH